MIYKLYDLSGKLIGENLSRTEAVSKALEHSGHKYCFKLNRKIDPPRPYSLHKKDKYGVGSFEPLPYYSYAKGKTKVKREIFEQVLNDFENLGYKLVETISQE